MRQSNYSWARQTSLKRFPRNLSAFPVTSWDRKQSVGKIDYQVVATSTKSQVTMYYHVFPSLSRRRKVLFVSCVLGVTQIECGAWNSLIYHPDKTLYIRSMIIIKLRRAEVQLKLKSIQILCVDYYGESLEIFFFQRDDYRLDWRSSSPTHSKFRS